MAGICGIIVKDFCAENIRIETVLKTMMLKLGANGQQERKSVSCGNFHFGNVAPVNKKADENFIYNEKFEIYCLVDGLVYVEESEKHRAEKVFDIDRLKNEMDYLPYLYLLHGPEYVKKITGWFNIFIADVKNGIANLSNDRLGLLPMFFCQSDTSLIFASKIESIIASGLTGSIEFDRVTIVEQLLYNYPVSNHTFIKNILTLPAATQFNCSGSLVQSSYWSPGELIFASPLSKKKSLDLIDEALSHAVHKPFSGHNNPVCVSLTGGWDGRLVISYVLKKYRDRLRVFSFGADNSPDITIPKEIAGKEGFSYTPVILNQDYMDHFFIDTARNTIIYSNGVRSYRRSHYLYAMPLLAKESNTIVSGNFGDEMLKFSNVTPSEVISNELISLIQSGFSKRITLPDFEKNNVFSDFFNQSDISELYSRLQLLEKEVTGYETLSQKYFHLKLTRIAPKFFGSEINSYNDYITNFSPFLDYEFLKALNQTCYAGIHYPFNVNKLKYKEMSTLLYAGLIKRNYKKLLYYPTDRGFSVADVTNTLCKMVVYYKKLFNVKPAIKDPYFLGQADKLFLSFANHFNSNNGSTVSGYLLEINKKWNNPKMRDKLLSINYWLSYITREYYH
jgi:asparagine synthetase B (glutamine-hydrolysing)